MTVDDSEGGDGDDEIEESMMVDDGEDIDDVDAVVNMF